MLIINSISIITISNTIVFIIKIILTNVMINIIIINILSGLTSFINYQMWFL